MKLSIILIVILVLVSQVFPQNGNDELVKIGDKTITVEQFKYRYELTPQIERKNNDTLNAKEELLYTLIAENLFAIEAEKQGFDTLQFMKMNYIPIVKMHVRDALYKKEISDSVKFNVESFNKGLRLANHKLFVDFVYAKEKQQIERAYEFLTSNSNFDSLVTLLKDAEYVSNPYEVTYGKMPDEAEEAIFNLEINEFTKPIESHEGWNIFRLINKTPMTYSNVDHKITVVKKVVEGRAEDSIFNNFWTAFFENQKVTTDGSLFWYFTDEIHRQILKIKFDRNIKENEKITMTKDDFISFRNSLNPDSLKKDFIIFNKKPLTLGEFLNDFAFEGFYTFSTDLNQIAAKLKYRVKRQIELELLTREGYRRGIEGLPEVKKSIEIWYNNYLSSLYLKTIVLNTELTDADIKIYLGEENNNSIKETQVNIIEVLSDSLEVIRDALSLSENSESFIKFAKIHTKREWAKDKSGEFGYFSVSEYGEIGKIAESMEVGDIYGPLETVDGYSVFKVVDKKESKISLNESKIDENVKRKIKYKKVTDHLENLAVELAEKYNLKVNNDLLNSLDLLNAKMVVYRYMGFGGRIQAYPYSSPFYKWKEKWEQKKKDLL